MLGARGERGDLGRGRISDPIGALLSRRRLLFMIGPAHEGFRLHVVAFAVAVDRLDLERARREFVHLVTV